MFMYQKVPAKIPQKFLPLPTLKNPPVIKQGLQENIKDIKLQQESSQQCPVVNKASEAVGIKMSQARELNIFLEIVTIMKNQKKNKYNGH